MYLFVSGQNREQLNVLGFLISSLIKSIENYHRLTMCYLSFLVRLAMDVGREEKAPFILSILGVGYLLTLYLSF
jgi:hypothetical protein